MAGKATKPPAKKKTMDPKTNINTKEKPLSKALGPAAEDFGREIKPLGKEVGEVTVRAVRTLLLRPASSIVNGIDSCHEWVSSRLSNKLSSVPDDKLVEPQGRIAWPSLQAIVYAGDDETIRQMFVNLLASDMNSDTKALAHPSFVEIIKQMTGFEARLLKLLCEGEGEILLEHRRDLGNEKGYNVISKSFSFNIESRNPNEIEVGCNNLLRLGLLNISDSKYPNSDGFDKMKIDYQSKIDELMPPTPPESNDIGVEGIFLTALGRQFSKVCLE